MTPPTLETLETQETIIDRVAGLEERLCSLQERVGKLEVAVQRTTSAINELMHEVGKAPMEHMIE